MDVQHRLLSGAYTDPELGRTPFSHVAARYLELGVWRPRTRQSATEKLRYAVEHFGDRPVATIRKGDVQAFISTVAQTLAPSTVRVVRRYTAAAFEHAVDDRLIAVNPCKGLRLPRVEQASILPLSHDDIVGLYDGAAEWFRIAIVIGAGIGLRQSEAAGLTLDRVDFLRRTVRVDRQWQQVSGPKPGSFTPPKTPASTRIVPVGDWVLREINSHLASFGTGRSGTLVHSDGAPLDAARWGHHVRQARKHAGLSPVVSFHDLRHFYPSALIASGCSVKQVQSALGHESAKVTLDVYGHLRPGDEDRVRDAIDRMVGGGLKELGTTTA